jgi:phytoene synthase
MKKKFDTLSVKCSKATTKLYSTSFSLGILFLNKELRDPIYSIYGFVRLADEIVDSFHAFDKATLLAEFKQECYRSIERGISLNPVLNSFQQVVNRYRIKTELIDQFFTSMEMDLQEQLYTPESYEAYILGSAQVVGLMCLQVFTNGNDAEYERLKQPAMKLGSAFQKVNFLRDIQADYRDLSRTYFPEIDLTQFTDTEKRLIEQDISTEFNQALQGILQLPNSSRRGVYLAYIYYRKLFTKLSNVPAKKVLSKRIRISNGHKVVLMFNSLIRYKLNLM